MIDANGIILSSSQGLHHVGQRNTQIEITRALQGIGGTEWDVVTRSVCANGRRPFRSGMTGVSSVPSTGAVDGVCFRRSIASNAFYRRHHGRATLTAMLSIILSNTITQPIKEITKKATRHGGREFQSAGSCAKSGRDRPAWAGV